MTRIPVAGRARGFVLHALDEGCGCASAKVAVATVCRGDGMRVYDKRRRRERGRSRCTEGYSSQHRRAILEGHTAGGRSGARRNDGNMRSECDRLIQNRRVDGRIDGCRRRSSVHGLSETAAPAARAAAGAEVAVPAVLSGNRMRAWRE